METRLEDLAAKCIRCGLCLEACPTFVLDGDETRSPRGRIALTLAAERGEMPWDATRQSIETCLGCRACETACPSGVHYGEILEFAKSKLGTRPARAFAINLLSEPSLARPLSALGSLAPGFKVPGILGIADSRPELDVPRRQEPSGWTSFRAPEPLGEVYLLSGCVAGEVFPRVEEAVRRLLSRVGYAVREVPVSCCGAMLAHGGLLKEASGKAHALALAMPGDLPVVVHTAGCGSTMKDYGHFGLPDFARRVVDVSEFLLSKGLANLLQESPGLHGLTVTYHDACHLLHGQKIRSQPRSLISAIPGLRLVDLPEGEMCCGSAGTYNMFEPATARRLLDRKWSNVEATGAQVVVQGNAGCHAWINQAAREHGGTVKVLHTAELLEASFSGLP